MFGNLGTIWAEIGVNTKKLDQGLMSAQTKLAGFDKTATGFGQSLTNQSTKLMIAGGLMAGAVAAVGVAAVKMAADFDKSMRNVNSIAKLSEKEFTNMSKEVLDLSTKLPQSAKELADGLYDISSSGFAGADGLEVLEASAKAASAGLTDTATSAKGITAVLNAYGLEAEDAAEISDTMFRTVDKGVITFEELSGGIGNVISTANLANIEFNELSGMIAYMTTKGVSAEETMTALNRLILSIIDPTEQLAAVLKSAGYESGEAAIEALGLTGVLDLMDKAAGGSLTKLQEMSPEMRALKASGALLGSGIGELNEFMKDFKDTTGATNTALAEQQKSLDYQLKLLKNNISAIGISLGNQYIPKLASATNAMSEFISEHREGTTAAINLGLAAGGSVGGLLLLAGIIGKVRGALLVLNGAIGGTLGLVAPAIAAAVNLGSAIYGLVDTIKKMRDGTIETEDALWKLAYPMIPLLEKMTGLGGATKEVAEQLDDTAARHLFFNNAVKESRDVIDDYTAVTENATDKIDEQAKSIDELTNEFNELIEEIFGGITTYNDFQEANWALDEAQKALTEAINEYGEGSRQAEQAQNDLDRANITAIETAFKLTQAIGATKAEQEEARVKAIELGSQYVNTGKIGSDAFIALATQFGLSVTEMIAYAKDLNNALDEATRDRVIQITTIEMNSMGFTKAGAQYARGGIIGNSGSYHPILSAASGLITPQTGRVVPVLAHEGEIILNTSQQKNLAEAIWGSANGRIGGGGVNIENFNVITPKGTPAEIAQETKLQLRLMGMEAAL